MADQAKPSKEEEKWKAEDDARTLAGAMAILDDPERLKKAKKAAKKLLEQEEEWAEEAEQKRKAMARLAGKGKMSDYSDKFNEIYG